MLGQNELASGNLTPTKVKQTNLIQLTYLGHHLSLVPIHCQHPLKIFNYIYIISFPQTWMHLYAHQQFQCGAPEIATLLHITPITRTSLVDISNQLVEVVRIFSFSNKIAGPVWYIYIIYNQLPTDCYIVPYSIGEAPIDQPTNGKGTCVYFVYIYGL